MAFWDSFSPFVRLFGFMPKRSVGCWLPWVGGGWWSSHCQEETDFPDGGSSPSAPPTILPPSPPRIKRPSVVIFCRAHHQTNQSTVKRSKMQFWFWIWRQMLDSAVDVVDVNILVGEASHQNSQRQSWGWVVKPIHSPWMVRRMGKARKALWSGWQSAVAFFVAHPRFFWLFHSFVWPFL